MQFDHLRKELSAGVDQTERRIAQEFDGQGPPDVPTDYMRRVRQKYLSAPLDQQFAYIKQASGAQSSQQLLLAVGAYEKYWEGLNVS